MGLVVCVLGCFVNYIDVLFDIVFKWILLFGVLIIDMYFYVGCVIIFCDFGIGVDWLFLLVVELMCVGGMNVICLVIVMDIMVVYVGVGGYCFEVFCSFELGELY